MTIKPKRLFSNLFLWAIFLIALFSIIFLVIDGYNTVAFFIAIFSFLFLLFNMIGVPSEFIIEKDEIIFNNKSYKLTDDLKNYAVKSEMIWYKNVKLPNELLILSFKDGDVLVIRSRIFENYSDIKKAILSIVG